MDHASCMSPNGSLPPVDGVPHQCARLVERCNVLASEESQPGRYDVVVIGGGIAGVSIGYELAEDRSICLLEMESTLAFHTTGRSAAAFLESYGNEPIRALTSASRAFMVDPPDLFDSPLTSSLPLMFIAASGRSQAIRDLHADVSKMSAFVALLEGRSADLYNPLLRPGFTELAMVEPGALEIDVHELHQGYVRGLARRGGVIARSAAVVSAEHDGFVWSLRDESGREYRAPLVVNAAGAWCDRVGSVLGAEAIGVRPLRRTVFIVPAPIDLMAERVPLTIDIDDSFYFKPDSGHFLCSPADETPQSAGDARPDHAEIARAIDAINEATIMNVRHVRGSWAGLRNFVPDRSPVVGYDPHVEGLFWFAGQGGYGIQIAPALARTGAALLRGSPIPADVADRGLRASMIDPGRSGPGDGDEVHSQ